MKLTAKPLSPAEISNIIQSKLDWILANSQPNKVILFGSAANQNMTEASDVDMIVLFKNQAELRAAQNILNKNRPHHDWPHDILWLTDAEFENYLKKGGGACWLAAREGKVLYEGSQR